MFATSKEQNLDLDNQALTGGKYAGFTPAQLVEVNPDYVIGLYLSQKGPRCSAKLYYQALNIAPRLDPTETEDLVFA